MSISSFVTRLSNVLGPPDSANPKGYVEELERLFRGYSEEELDEAATLIFQTQKTTRWPTPAIMLACAKQGRDTLRRLNNPVRRMPRRLDSLGEPYQPRSELEDWNYWSREAFEAADRLIQSDMGRKAAHEGWINDLHDFCRQHRRLPVPKEQSKLIRAARLTDKLYQDALDNPVQSFSAVRPLALLEGSRRLRKQLSQIANGEQP